MPVYQKHGTTALDLVQLLEKVIENNERPTVIQEAGDSWVVVSEPKPGRPKVQTR